MVTKFFYVFLLLHFNGIFTRKVSVEKSMVFGPALNPNIVMPVRYFYVQAVDTKGKNYTYSPGKDTFTLNLIRHDGERLRAYRNILDRNDGSFIIRFRLYNTFNGLTIEVKHDGKHVAKSPYVIKGDIYHELCYCPQNDYVKWSEDMKCSQNVSQINIDLKQFPKINFDDIHGKVLRHFGENHALCHYSVIENQVYRKCYGQHTGFKMFMDAWLLSLARKVRLPDMEFFSNLGDWPLSKKRNKEAFPIFSWCGSDETNDLVMPTYDLTESTLESLGRVTLDMQSVQGNVGPSWKNKIEKGFFRGRDSRQERLDLTIMGRKNTDLFDVALTNFFFFPYDEKLYGPKNQRVSFFDFFKYKYQINVDGTVAAYRLPYLLAGDAVILKQDSNYYEHFYHDLSPMEHYIPFKRDLSDIKEKIEWAKKNDKKVRQIGIAGQTYARDNLMGDRLFCYSAKLFQEYAARLISKPRVRDGQEHVKQSSERDSECYCNRKPSKESKKSKESNEARDEL